MRRRTNLSIAQMACLSILGGLLSASSFLLLILLRSQHTRDTLLTNIGCGVSFFVLLLGGLALSLSAESTINNGIAAERWPEDRVESLRRILRSPWSVAASVLVLILFVVCNLFLRHTGIGWMVFLFGQTLWRLTIAVRPPTKPRDPNPLTQWRTWSRINSSHWGER
jgi:hypothetical protein